MALNANSRIVLLRIKIERAKKHLRDLETEVTACRDKTLNVHLSDEDPETGQIVQHLATVPVFSFEILSAAGDVIHSLRTALDHLAYQLAVVGSGRPPGRGVEFPISKDQNTYEREKARKVEGMRLEVVEAIDAIKPYKGGNDILWRIHELDNIDKHRFVFVIAKDALFDAPWYSADASIANSMPFLIRPRTLNTDTPLFSGVFDSESENGVNFEIEKALSETKTAQSNALLPSLRLYVDVVEELILSFRPFLG
jgi:hypothetical protein